MKSEPSTRTQAPIIKEQESCDVIYELLNALVLPIESSQPEETENTETTANKATQSSPGTSSQTASTSRDTMRWHIVSGDILSGSSSHANEILNLDGQDELRVRITRNTGDTAENKTDEPAAKRPILAKHCILKILADAVVSYSGIAKLITDYNYKSKASEHIPDVSNIHLLINITNCKFYS